MHFQFEMIDPREDLKPFICRHIYMNTKLEQPFDVAVMPTGHTFFVKCFSKVLPHTEYRFKDGTVVGNSRWRLVGQMTGDELNVFEPEMLHYMSSELEPTTVYRLFGVNGSDVAQKSVCLSETAPHLMSLAQECFVADETANKEDHIREVNIFFGELAANAGPGDDLVESAITVLKRHNGALAIGDLCQELGANVRTLNRRFSMIVGLTPKIYAKTLQINWAIGLLLQGDARSISDIAVDAGFFDQAHFSNAVKAFFQQSPNAFLDSDHVDLIKFFDEINRAGPVIVQSLNEQ